MSETSITKPRKIKALFYAVNGIGLGHLTRLLAVCLALKKSQPNGYLFEPFFFTNSEASSVLADYHLPSLTVPSKRLLYKKNILSLGEQSRLYAQQLNNLYEILRPQIVISDTFPLGVHRDLEFLLRNSNSYHILIRRAQKPETVTAETIASQKLYDRVVAPHPTDSEWMPMPENGPPLHWSGPLMLTETAFELSGKDILSRSGIDIDTSDKKPFTVLINLGGGGDENKNRLWTDIEQEIRKLPPDTLVLWATGLLSVRALPFEPAPNYRIIRQYPLAPVYPFADAAVSSAGYNSFHELLFFGIPTVFLPQARGLDDQHQRVKKASEHQACLTLTENDSLFEVLLKWYHSEDLRNQYALNAKRYVPENGAERLAQKIWNDFLAQL